MIKTPFFLSPCQAAMLCAWLIGSLFLSPPLAFGEERTLHLELSYSGTASSFNLYKDSVLVCTQNTPTPAPDQQTTKDIPGTAANTTYQMDCTVATDPTPMTFVLTAVDSNGIESPQSAPYLLMPPPVAIIAATPTKSGTAAVNFDAAASFSPYGITTSYIWDFGDGTKASGLQATKTYLHDGDFTVVLTVTDDHGANSQDRILLSVLTNSPPTAANQSLQVQTKTVSGVVWTKDADNDPLTFSITRLPSHGTVEFDPTSGKFVYRPAPRFVGKDSFDFMANDGQANSNTATVTLTVVSRP